MPGTGEDDEFGAATDVSARETCEARARARREINGRMNFILGSCEVGNDDLGVGGIGLPGSDEMMKICRNGNEMETTDGFFN